MQTPGTILLVSGDLVRYADCMWSIMQMEKPLGTQFLWQRGCSVVDNLNNGIRAMRPESEWLWIMGDDHVWAPTMLMDLLKHEVDFVAPYVCKRQWPFGAVVYEKEARPGLWQPAMRMDLPPTGLYEAAAGTNAGLLVRRRVLDAIGDPWFKFGQQLAISRGAIGEDVTFWKEAREKGFKGYIDMDAKLGHITPMVIWPMDGGKIGVELEVSAGVRLPIAFPFEQVKDPEGNVLAERGTLPPREGG